MHIDLEIMDIGIWAAKDAEIYIKENGFTLTASYSEGEISARKVTGYYLTTDYGKLHNIFTNSVSEYVDDYLLFREFESEFSRLAKGKVFYAWSAKEMIDAIVEVETLLKKHPLSPYKKEIGNYLAYLVNMFLGGGANWNWQGGGHLIYSNYDSKNSFRDDHYRGESFWLKDCDGECRKHNDPMQNELCHKECFSDKREFTISQQAQDAYVFLIKNHPGLETSKLVSEYYQMVKGKQFVIDINVPRDFLRRRGWLMPVGAYEYSKEY